MDRQTRTGREQSATISDDAVRYTAGVIAGRLRSANVSPHVLKEFKQELEGFDSKRRQWKG